MTDDPKDPLRIIDGAAEAPMVTLPIGISSTGRTVSITAPQDLTPDEIAELCGFLLTQLAPGQRIALAKRTGPQLVVHRGPLPT